MKLYPRYIKRLLDFSISLVALLVLLPVFLLVTLLLFVANRGDVFFLQPRPGKGGKVFRVIKFKTMNDLKDKQGKLLPDEQRLTPVGKFVRKTSLDEIPQLLNVLKGEMSLIGPRPLLVEYLPLYTERQHKRHEVRPGITGLAAVKGRNALTWDEKFEYDARYVENLSFALDLKILLLTVEKVLKSEGVTAQGHATMPSFIDHVRQKNQN
ncbi:lipopolysaccharide/colanic/teichoic acid biosynthesis glycosyltransferase [Pontibacter ummariensis]|uniref:Sugar transferase involved in LPS biosynthesis (Colanic, teichoic acid) n=1 Tax=Pontibacter ummariensis TaxID=1610492 RepID=A0A239EMR6_9BACT|nr:sugar transferase [Pontibacter ummariensis]PRY13310.1 lipopolysaccharide/colanic/teichoic acid biosynthesis glycosyltransferase [Pontibacter ummariensis]SNS45164.1 Sugar transferase involved in LPS biosynthesis (colanic, teichoic acid) [Pontibacter ummariensis]